MDTAQGKVIAARIDALLKNGAPVYVSSLSYPERIVLSHLYDMWDGSAHDSYEFACNLDNKNLLRGFQTYSLERIELLPDTGAHIYKIVKRAQEVKVAEVDPIFEGERLGFLSSSGPGRCIAQSLGVEWSGGGHILCIDNKIGDEIILNTPYYFNHEMAIKMAGCHPVLVATDANYQLIPEAINAAITNKTRAVVTISPNNPTGVIYSETALKQDSQNKNAKKILSSL
jgi:hypothetical protein